jgi:hypothetical protein
MSLLLLLTAMIILAVLAPRFGADSREPHLRTTAVPHPRSTGRGWVLQEPGPGHRAGSATAAVRRFVEQQVHLQQRYAERHGHSGREAVMAARPLRWDGDHLVGDVLGRSRER